MQLCEAMFKTLDENVKSVQSVSLILKNRISVDIIAAGWFEILAILPKEQKIDEIYMLVLTIYCL